MLDAMHNLNITNVWKKYSEFTTFFGLIFCKQIVCLKFKFLRNLKVKEFDWNSKEQGLVLSSFFYGYITSQILGGYLATRIGAARLFGSAILVTAIMTLLTPVFAYQGIWPLVFVRAAQGVCQVKDHYFLNL